MLRQEQKGRQRGTARDAGDMNMISTLENSSSFAHGVVVCVVVAKKEVPQCTTT
jgi:hypothetical protein